MKLTAPSRLAATAALLACSAGCVCDPPHRRTAPMHSPTPPRADVRAAAEAIDRADHLLKDGLRRLEQATRALRAMSAECASPAAATRGRWVDA